jgi:zinc carboxypeptidase
MRRLIVFIVLAGLAGTTAAAQRRPAPRPAPARTARPAPIPTPRSVLGFEPGDDRKLVEWPVLVRYYQALARASDRVDYREIGKTTLGAPFVALFISSPANLRNLARYRRLNEVLADPRRIENNRHAITTLRDGKTIVLITSSIHSTEVGGFFTPAVLAHRLATDTSAETRAILDHVILVMVPSLNPDGVTIVSRWYNRTLGTPAEGAEPPELYHHYTGHDNNRDWYAFTQIETQLTVDSLHNVWHPQIVHDIHQMGSGAARLFAPPYLDPWEPNVDPTLTEGANALGTAIAWELTGQGKRGVVFHAIYDAWTPARAYSHYHGGVRLLTETASAQLATPIDITADELTPGRGYDPKTASWNFPNPWAPGRWRLADIVEYQTSGAYALLRHAARNRATWLDNFLSVSWRGVRGWPGWPYAYVIPRSGQNESALPEMLNVLYRGGVEIRQAERAFAVGARRFNQGAYVIVLRQPYAAFAKALLERQRYPDLRLTPEGAPIPPYDVTAHTLPLLMGVQAVEVSDSIAVPLSRPMAPPPVARRYPGFESNPPRVGLYRSYEASMDEGWTRWVFDTWKVPYASLVDSVVRVGGLRAKFDAIVIPDQAPRELLDGLSARRYPAPYAGGLGQEGAAALKQFVTDGGTLIAFNRASQFLIQQLLLPVRNVVEGTPGTEFYAPGSLFRLQVDTAAALAARMPAQTAGWFEEGPLFDVVDSAAVRIIARYPANPDQVLLSGWLLGARQAAGRAAVVEVRLGQGRVILFGIRPQYRGQSLATYPLIFNGLLMSR